ncbi:hypothetical protein [Actinokineospora enzanensis]|uniref:hypothetical protein n=1 Tax=Actinokineospora enzanensis TaxID=155975 RepID=UPI0012EC6A2C|nr:hypothetical protein [Actinokineospora enzanensis]
MRNPYVLPGREFDPARPPRPWDPAERDLGPYPYSDFGGHADGFDRFKAALANAESRCAAGLVVVVDGPERCGKSTLLHRCAGWLREKLGGDERVHVFDFSENPYLGPSDGSAPPTVDNRLAHLAQLITVRLHEFQMEGWTRDLSDPGTDLTAAYGRLGTLHRTDKNRPYFLIIPPALQPDLPMPELERVRAQTSPGVVTFLEYSSAGHGPPPPDGRPRPPVRVSLRYLEADETDKVVHAWPGADAARPDIAEGAMTQLQSSPLVRQLSMGMFLGTLQQVYASRTDPANRFRDRDSVDYVELFEAMFEVLRRQSATGRRW